MRFLAKHFRPPVGRNVEGLKFEGTNGLCRVTGENTYIVRAIYETLANFVSAVTRHDRRDRIGKNWTQSENTQGEAIRFPPNYYTDVDSKALPLSNFGTSGGLKFILLRKCLCRTFLINLSTDYFFSFNYVLPRSDKAIEVEVIEEEHSALEATLRLIKRHNVRKTLLLFWLDEREWSMAFTSYLKDTVFQDLNQ